MFEKKIILSILIILFKPCFRCLTTVPIEQQDKDLQVQISNGVLQGQHIISEFKNVSFYSFFGIPYAQPPVGDLRFRPPQPTLNWTGVLDARTERSHCPQFSEGSEDCLFINVYTPYANTQRLKNNLLPVMVWIHGGAFVLGSANFTFSGPDRLIEHGVVIAVLQYRLGVFGFLSTGDMALPGNYGLKDQIQALKWIQSNIQHFGGNPSQVIIFGESAGGASVHYLLQTPLTNNLFHGAISESGCTLCFWALARNPKNTAFKVAEFLGIETNNTEELTSKLRATEFTELASIGDAIIMEELQNIYDDGLPFSPCIEPQHENAIITKETYALLSSNEFNKVPLLTGFNSQETALMGLVSIQPLIAKKDESPGTFVHNSMNISSNSTRVKVGQEIRSFYFGKGLASTAPRDTLFDFLSDDMFLRPIKKTVQLHSQSVPVYFYRFSYAPPQFIYGKRTFKGVAHSEELSYIFYNRNKKTFNVSTSISLKMVKMWTNFAKTGNPTPIPEKLLNYVTWPVANNKKNVLGVTDTDSKINDVTFLDINDNLTVNVNPREQAMQFWEDLFQKYPSIDDLLVQLASKKKTK